MVREYKMVLCGKTGVGKTTIFRRLCGRSVLDCQQSAANTAKDHECKITTKVGDETVELNLWDTLGFEKYAQYTRSHFLLTQAVLLVYSATDKDSLSNAAELLRYAKIHAQGARIFLVRNKIDLEPTVSDEDAVDLIPERATALQFRTSALKDEGIQEMLKSIATHLFREATPMKPIGRSTGCGGLSCRNGVRFTASEPEVVQLELEEEEAEPRQRRRRRWKCWSS